MVDESGAWPIARKTSFFRPLITGRGEEEEGSLGMEKGCGHVGGALGS